MRRLSTVLTLLSVLALGLLPISAHGADGPTTIPALRQWTGAYGTYIFSDGNRVVVDGNYADQLGTTAQVLADDLSQLTGSKVQVDTGGTPQAGDIVLTLGSTDSRPDFYSLSLGSTATVQAAGDAGEFYGTRTLLQLLRQSRSVPAGTAQDWSANPERGLMVDVGRKYFSVPWLQQEIKDLAYVKMNYLHLHLSDNYGFRLESSTHPEITSAQHYTKQEITDLIALGARYHVTVVPEIDMPGHLDAVLAAHPELRLKDVNGNASSSFIDLANPASYHLLKDLINEYLPLFPAGYWHLGADEYITDYADYPQLQKYAHDNYGSNATAKDVFYGFVNWADALVRAGSKTMRMWNDGIKSGDGTLKPNNDITVDYWTASGLTPQQLVDAGYTVMNSSSRPTYYVLGGGKPDTAYLYQSWQPGLFQGGATINDQSRNRGSALHVWCDHPNAETERQTAAGIFAPVRALAQQTWGSPKPVSAYGDFQGLIALVGRAPGWPAYTAAGDLALRRPATASSTEIPAFQPVNAVDGSYDTRWSSAHSDPQWLQLDLGSAQQVNHVKLTWEAAYARAFQLQFSDDASNWTTAYSTSHGNGGVQDLTGLTGSGRYLRLYLTERATQYGYSLWQVEAYHDASSPAAPSAGHSYVLATASGNGVADVNGGSGAPGAIVIQYHPTGGSNQQWTLQDAGDNAFHLLSVKSGLCLDVSGSATGDNAPVIQWNCSGGQNQTWTLRADQTGGWNLVAQHSGKLLTVGDDGSPADATPLVQSGANGTAYQRWYLTPAG